VTRTTYALFALLATVMVLAIAGCGSSGGSESSSGGSYGGGEGSQSASAGGGRTYGSGGGSEGEEKPASSAGGAANVSLGSAGDLGMVLVDSKGFVLYDFHKDKGTKPSCYGACAENWPPVLTEGAPDAGNGAKASMLGTTMRTDGTEQATYAGHPLYTFVGDKKPGEANGNDITAFGGEWYALMANGEEPKD
jgi:predicted lipoprotein with Yx(FWY)xxD motif